MSKHEQCATCAFREGCETQREPDNVLKALICANSGQPFFCHDQVNWRTAVPTRALLREVGICCGWQEEVRKRVRLGWFGAQSGLRQVYGKIALALLEEFIALEEGPEKRRVHQSLKKSIKIITQKELVRLKINRPLASSPHPRS
jgi:hypothetical protein